VRAVPVRLSVLHFTLPDLPSARTMLSFSQEEIDHRYLGAEHRLPAAGTAVYTQGWRWPTAMFSWRTATKFP
jgi:hypothetical protein